MTHDPQRAGLETEADVDVRIVLPILTALGITPSNVRAQRTFTVRLGRSEVRVGSDVRRGRADYLVTNDENEPLFVLELKGLDEPLTDDDRDQAISYARLVHPMPPLVVLSNGRQLQLFDTVTKAPVDRCDPEARRSGAVLGHDDALRLRAEALEHFVGYSRENVTAFSRAQMRAGMESLRGDGQHLRKYETDLYVARPRARALFSEFLQQARRCVFALGGSSGVGKTNEMCALAEYYANDHVTLFLHGPDLGAPLATVLADAFAWHFAEVLPLPHVCRRLDSLARRSGTPVLLFIDAIDEAASPFVAQELGALATQLALFGGWIRLILSAKSVEWPRLLRIRGVETPLARQLFAPAGASPLPSNVVNETLAAGRQSLGNETNDDGPRLSCTLERFDAEEAADAHARYADAFGLEPALFRVHGNDPFLLRIVAEVAQDASRRSLNFRSDTAVDELTLVRAYIDAKMRRMVEADRARRELTVVASALTRCSQPRQGQSEYGRGVWGEALVASTGSDEGQAAVHHANTFSEMNDAAVPPLAEALARDAAQVAVGDPFAEELVAFGVLLRVQDADGTAFLSFAYDRVRDYAVAIFGFAFPSLRAAELAPVLANCMTTSLGRAAFMWYLPYFRSDQWLRVEELAGERAEESLVAYERLQAHILPVARDAMDQARSYSLGVVYSLTPRGQFSLGYFPRWRDELPRARIERDAAGPWRESLERVQRGIHPSVERFRGAPWYLADPTHAAAEHAADQMSRLLRGGHLLTLDPELQVERVVALAIQHAHELGLRSTLDATFMRLADHHLGVELFPLDLRDVRRRVQRALTMRWYRSICSDSDRADERARRDIAAGRDFSDTLVGDGELRELSLALKQLPDDLVEIQSPLLPGPDLLCEEPGAGWRSFERYYSDAQLTALLHAVFRRALDATRRTLQAALDPALLALIGPLPTKLEVEARRYAEDSPRAFSVYQSELRVSISANPYGNADREDAVTVRLLTATEWESRWADSGGVARNGQTSHARWTHEFGSSSMFVTHNAPPMIRGGKKWSGASQFAPVRVMVHLLLADVLRSCDTTLLARLARGM